MLFTDLQIVKFRPRSHEHVQQRKLRELTINHQRVDNQSSGWRARHKFGLMILLHTPMSLHMVVAAAVESSWLMCLGHCRAAHSVGRCVRHCVVTGLSASRRTVRHLMSNSRAATAQQQH